MTRARLCFVTAVPMTVTAFLNAHIERLADDFEVFVVSDFSGDENGVSPRATRIQVSIPREISVGRDVAGLLALIRTFRRHRFDIVHSITPKAGLLSVSAGFLARVPVRIHWFTGQVWATRRGPARTALKCADRLLAGLATHLLADSRSQRDFLVSEGICPARRIGVLGDGSICGVDGRRFRPDAEARRALRAEREIPDDADVVLFVGRLNADKGLRELAQAMLRLDREFPSTHWLLVGPDEGGMEAHVRGVASTLGRRLHFPGPTREPERFMAAADVFCVPSHREGFGISVLEAAAAGVPGVATRIYGLTDAVEDEGTGLLVPPRDPAALADAIAALLRDPARRRAMGTAARERALRSFSSERIVGELAEFYRRILFARGSS